MARRVCLAVASIGWAYAVALVALSYSAVGSWLQWAFVPAFVLVFPVHLRTVLVLSAIVRGRQETDARTGRRWSRWRTLRWGDLAALAPKPVIVAVGVWCAVAWAGLMYGITASPGQPVARGGRYFLDDHGVLAAVSHSTYVSTGHAGARAFFLAASAFLALAVPVNWRPVAPTAATGGVLGGSRG